MVIYCIFLIQTLEAGMLKLRSFISVLTLFIFTFFSALCLGGYADESGDYGDGSAGNPFQIDNVQDFMAIGLRTSDWDKHFILTGDIDMGGFSGNDYKIIGTAAKPFSGVFDGKGHKITNFKYSTSGSGGLIGLFGNAENADIGNFAVTNAQINAPNSSRVGIAVGKCTNTKLHGIFVKGGSVTASTVSGNLVGTAIKSEISDSAVVDGHLDGVENLGLGLGYGLETTVTNSSFSGKVIGRYGGIAGFCGRAINFNSSGISVDAEVIGVERGAGYLGTIFSDLSIPESSGNVIENSSSQGRVTVAPGGVASGFINSASDVTVNNCFSATAMGTITPTISGFIGEISNGDVNNSFWDVERSGVTQSAAGTGKTTAEMYAKSTYKKNALWFFSGDDNGSNVPAWTICDGEDYPQHYNAEQETYSGGCGTKNAPYQISFAEDFKTLTQHPEDWGKQFILTQDIDLSGLTEADLSPIGVDGSEPFSGGFNGDGHLFENYHFVRTNELYVAPFGSVSGEDAEIIDVHFDNSNINGAGGDNVAGLVGHLSDGAKVAGCSVTDSAITGDNNVALLVGECDNGSVSGSLTSGIATASGDNCGGIVGLLKNATLFDCVSTGNASSDNNCGNLVGHADGSIAYNCYATGTAAATTAASGGCVGLSSNGATAFNLFWDTNTSTNATSDGGIGKTTAELFSANTFTGWGCASNWTIDDGSAYPHLTWQKMPGTSITTCPIPFDGGSGTLGDPFLIATSAQLNDIGQTPTTWDNHFKQTAPIDMSGFTSTEYNVIGLSTKPFTGTYNGDGHAISNLTYNDPEATNIGLFGLLHAEDAAVANVNMIDCNITGKSSVGAVVGQVGNGVVDHCVVTNCTVAGGADYTGDIGGAVGLLQDGTLTNIICQEGTVNSTALSAGGIVGRVQNGALINGQSINMTIESTNSGAGGAVGRLNFGSAENNTVTNCVVNGKNQTGGFAGVNMGTIVNCHSSGSITGDSKSGGLVGDCENASHISYSASSCTVNKRDLPKNQDYHAGLVGNNKGGIYRCSSSGDVFGNDDTVGGLVGENFGNISQCFTTSNASANDDKIGGFAGRNYGVITNCYSTGTATTPGTLECGGFVGYNTSNGKLINCYTQSSALPNYSGGFVGSNTGAALATNCFWDAATSGNANVVTSGDFDTLDVTNITAAQMQTMGTFTDVGWDFVGEDTNGTADIWRMCEDGVSPPLLNWTFSHAPSCIEENVTVTSLSIDGAAEVETLKSSDYTCILNYSDGSFVDVTDEAVWYGVSWPDKISPDGTFTAGYTTETKTVGIYADYDGLTTIKTVTINDVYISFYLRIEGGPIVLPFTVNNYQCYAHYSDGTIETVTDDVSWDESGTATSISEGGTLTVGDALGNDTVEIFAYYKGETDTHTVTVIGAPTPVEGALGISEPATNISVEQGAVVPLTWTDGDSGTETSIVMISYDIDNNNMGDNAVAIGSFSTQDETNTLSWDTALVAAGTYTIWGRIYTDQDESIVKAVGTVTISEPVLPLTNYDIKMTKLKIKVGENRSLINKDSFTASGKIPDAILDQLKDFDSVEDFDGIYTELSHASTVTGQNYGFITILGVDNMKYSVKKKKFTYKKKLKKGVDSGVSELEIDLKKGKYKLSTKYIDLTGMSSPVNFVLEIKHLLGKTILVKAPGGALPSGSEYMQPLKDVDLKKGLPLTLLVGVQDVLDVRELKHKLSKKGDSLKVSGKLSMADITTDYSLAPMTIAWGNYQLDILAASISLIKGKYVISQKTETEKLIGVINIHKAKFEIKITKAIIPEQAEDSAFKIIY